MELDLPTPVSRPPSLESGSRFCSPKPLAEIRRRSAENGYVNLPLPLFNRLPNVLAYCTWATKKDLLLLAKWKDKNFSFRTFYIFYSCLVQE
jgi:hypothetical protein